MTLIASGDGWTVDSREAIVVVDIERTSGGTFGVSMHRDAISPRVISAAKDSLDLHALSNAELARISLAMDVFTNG